MQKYSQKVCSAEFTPRKIQTLSSTVSGVLVYFFENKQIYVPRDSKWEVIFVLSSIVVVGSSIYSVHDRKH